MSISEHNSWNQIVWLLCTTELDAMYHKCLLTDTKLFHWSVCPCRLPQKAITYIPKAYDSITITFLKPRDLFYDSTTDKDHTHGQTGRRTLTTTPHKATEQSKVFSSPTMKTYLALLGM